MVEQFENFKGQTTGRLYIVPTPIGNLDDITLRALTVLQEVDLIAAEDTRHSGELLKHFEIPTKMTSLHEHNYSQQIPKLIENLLAGQSIAQVSDAGTPLVSDPGQQLVNAAIDNQIPVIALPGATASITALVASGLPSQPFLFYGFISPKQQKAKSELESLSDQTSTLIFYEAPHRVVQTLKLMVEVFGGQRLISIGRELTKLHESYLRTTLQEALEYFENHQPRGEFVLVVAGNQQSEIVKDDKQLIDEINQLVSAGQSATQAIKQVAELSKVNKNYLYDLYHSKD